MEKLLTTEDIGKVLKISPRSVTLLLHREKLGHKIGRRLFVTEKEFNLFLEKTRLSRPAS